MSNIKYNAEQEAYELPYKIWDKVMTVRFYAESEEEIMSHLSDIAMKLETINGGKKKIARLITDEGRYEGAAETLAKEIEMTEIYIDIDEDEIVVCFTVTSADGYLTDKTMAGNVSEVLMELYDDEFEFTSFLG